MYQLVSHMLQRTHMLTTLIDVLALHVDIDGPLVLLKSALTKLADNVEFLDFLAKDNIW